MRRSLLATLVLPLFILALLAGCSADVTGTDDAFDDSNPTEEEVVTGATSDDETVEVGDEVSSASDSSVEAEVSSASVSSL